MTVAGFLILAACVIFGGGMAWRAIDKSYKK